MKLILHKVCDDATRQIDVVSSQSDSRTIIYPPRFLKRKLLHELSFFFFSQRFYVRDIRGSRREIVKCDCFADVPISPCFVLSPKSDGNSNGLRNIIYSYFLFPLLLCHTRKNRCQIHRKMDIFYYQNVIIALNHASS